MSCHQFIKQAAAVEPRQGLCCVLEVSAAGCYQWLRRADRPTPAWKPTVTASFSRHAQRYGTRQSQADLRAGADDVGHYAWRTRLRGQGLRALSIRLQRPRTTIAEPAAVVAENLLLGQAAPTAPNQGEGGGITYHLSSVGGRWRCMATWRDTCSRCAVSWHRYQQMHTELIRMVLTRALTLRQLALDLLSHNDRGSQYISLACWAHIEKVQAQVSGRRPDNPYTNAQAEDGWNTLLTKLLPYGGVLVSFGEARLEVAYYRDTYCNFDRRPSDLDYHSPH